MVEFNAGGLISFFQTMKRVAVAVNQYGREYAAKIAAWIANKLVQLKTFIIEKYRAFFVRKDLSREELKSQLKFVGLVGKFLLFVIGVNVVRVLLKVRQLRRPQL